MKSKFPKNSRSEKKRVQILALSLDYTTLNRSHFPWISDELLFGALLPTAPSLSVVLTPPLLVVVVVWGVHNGRVAVVFRGKGHGCLMSPSVTVLLTHPAPFGKCWLEELQILSRAKFCEVYLLKTGH